MKKYKYIARPTATSGFAEASREELRVIVAIMESHEPVGESEIISLTGVSPARAKSAVAFWEAEGVISACEQDNITEEFTERVRRGEIFEEDSVVVAESIRDENLRGLLEEITAMVEKPALTDREIKCIVALVTQYCLTEDYILELAAHLKLKKGFSVNTLRDKALKLVEKGIDNTEALGIYLKNEESRSPHEMEFRRLLGIYDRTLSETERRVFSKWAEEFGYSTAIVGEAYNISVLNTGKLSIPYMDKVLTSWYTSGCKTIEECRVTNAQKTAEEKSKKAERKKPKSEAPKLRYGDFDVNDAFAKALERSYSTDEK